MESVYLVYRDSDPWSEYLLGVGADLLAAKKLANDDFAAMQGSENATLQFWSRDMITEFASTGVEEGYRIVRMTAATAH